MAKIKGGFLEWLSSPAEACGRVIKKKFPKALILAFEVIEPSLQLLVHTLFIELFFNFLLTAYVYVHRK